MKIMFVCSGNTCRSPMAEAIFKDMVKNVEVFSAGFSTNSGEEASDKAMIVCANHNLDLTHHRTTNISDSNVDSMDLVLTATISQRDKLRKLYPTLEIFAIKEYAGQDSNLDIIDPANGNLKLYDSCFCEIKDALEKIVETHNIY